MVREEVSVMSMVERQCFWGFPLVGTSQSSVGPRSSVQEPFSYELRGCDGTEEGGLRPHPGFREVHRFRTDLWGPNHDERSVITDLKPVSFVVGDNGYAYGFVYRVRRRPGAEDEHLSDVFLDLWDSGTGQMRMSRVLVEGIRADGEMTVVSWGRLNYVFVAGLKPFLFYLEREAPWGLVVVPSAGPGPEPRFASADEALPLGSLTDPGTGPAKGQLFLTEFTPEQTGIYGTGSSYDPPEDLSAIKIKPGDYAFVYVLVHTETGRRSAPSETAQCREIDFDPDAGGSRRPTPLFAAIEIVYDRRRYDRAEIYRSVRVQDAGGVYIAGILHLEAIIDLEKWSTVNNPLPNPDHVQAVYWVGFDDKRIALREILYDRESYLRNMPRAGAAVVLDGTLIVSSIFHSPEDQGTSTRDDPVRGSGEIRWSGIHGPSIELFPPANRYYPTSATDPPIVFANVGEHVIGWGRDRVYHVRRERSTVKVVEMHVGYGIINHRSVDTIASLAYYVNHRGVKTMDSQGTLEDVRVLNRIIKEEWSGDLDRVSLACDPMSSAVHVLNPVKGESATLWFGTSKVTSMSDLPFDLVVRGSWPMGFVFNLDYLMGVSEEPDASYGNRLMEVAFWLCNPVKDGPTDRVVGSPHRVMIMDVRRERVQTQGLHAGKPRRTLMPFAGDSVFMLAEDFVSGTDVVLNTTGKTLSNDLWGARLVVLDSVDRSMVGKRAVIRSTGGGPGVLRLTAGTASALHGLRAGDAVGVSPIPFRWVGRALGLEDPMDPDPERGRTDYFRVRHVNALGCSFSMVRNERSSDAPAAFVARVYDGEGDDLAGEGVPLTRGSLLAQSVVEGPSVLWAALDGTERPGVRGRQRLGAVGSFLVPSVSVDYPDIDFRMVGVVLEGRITASLRMDRAR